MRRNIIPLIDATLKVESGSATIPSAQLTQTSPLELKISKVGRAQEGFAAVIRLQILMGGPYTSTDMQAVIS